MRSSSVNQLILKTLAQDRSHLTAQQIYERIRENLPAVNPSTVYRSLERLAHAGQVSVSDMGQGAAVFEAVCGEQHHHLVCQECGRVTMLGNEIIHSLFDRIRQQYDFQVITNHLILFGRCSQCQQTIQRQIEEVGEVGESTFHENVPRPLRRVTDTCVATSRVGSNQ
jgi:Fur family ferric uptake transcriptional regulator